MVLKFIESLSVERSRLVVPTIFFSFDPDICVPELRFILKINPNPIFLSFRFEFLCLKA